MAIVFDVVVFAILILLVILGYKRGLIRTVVNLVGYVISAVLAFFVSLPVSQFLFSTFFKSSAVDLINQEIAKLSGGQSVAAMLDAAFAAIPKNISTFASEYVGPLDQVKDSIIATTPTTADLANVVVDTVIAPIATMLLQTIVFLVLFILFCIIVKLLTRTLKFIDKVPLVGTANAVLGAVFGVLEAFLFLFLFTTVIAFIIQISGNQLDSINQNIVNQTYVFKILYEYNPLLSIKIGA